MQDRKISFLIADRSSNAAELANFFRQNLTETYISHSELQGYRAVSPHKWSVDIGTVLETEIAARLGPPRDRFSAEPFWQGVVVGYIDKTLVALALVTISRKSAVPYGVIEDVVVAGKLRGQGYGEAAMRWIADRFRDADLRRAFLESGRDNKSAHHLFEKLGFKTISIVMMQDL